MLGLILRPNPKPKLLIVSPCQKLYNLCDLTAQVKKSGKLSHSSTVDFLQPWLTSSSTIGSTLPPGQPQIWGGPAPNNSASLDIGTIKSRTGESNISNEVSYTRIQVSFPGDYNHRTSLQYFGDEFDHLLI